MTFAAFIIKFLLEESLENICSATVIYLTIEGDILSDYNTIRDLTDRAVTSALLKINDDSRKLKVLEVLPQMKSGYRDILALKNVNALKLDIGAGREIYESVI
ncbi:4653_t:CDS:2 [Funneliformis mosseae]|uniref:4653_t:CDS:1 n=1 Tax=Funneliformis mosseae TaxID=27381 RepID=A0A9N9G8S8_FUNMO|nr:4653_t:CDS:2 [Funneliformis mosseae]